MATTIEIDDQLMQKALQAAGTGDVKQTVEKALAMLIERRHVYDELMKLRGTVEWDDDLDAMRRNK
jgi:antitoxin ParD1/3/4